MSTHPLTDIANSLWQKGSGHRTVPTCIEAHVPTKVYTAAELEERTRGQADNEEWHECRYGRVTGTTCGRVMQAATHAKKAHDRFMAPIARDILLPPGLVCARSIAWGVMKEKKAIDMYRQVKGPSVKVITDCGLYVDEKRPWLAFSPDGIVEEDVPVEEAHPRAGEAKSAKRET